MFSLNIKRIQEEDGGFFEKLGTRLAEKVQAEQLEERLYEDVVNSKDDKTAANCAINEKIEEEENLDYCVIEKKEALYAARVNELKGEPVEIPLETDSESDEQSKTLDIVAESLGLNVSFFF